MEYNINISNKITKYGLRKFNLVIGTLHLTQGIAVLFLSKVFTLPISGNYLAFNKTTQHLDPTSKVLFNLSLPILIAIFFFLSATAHFVIATVYKDKYEKDLDKVMNIQYRLAS